MSMKPTIALFMLIATVVLMIFGAVDMEPYLEYQKIENDPMQFNEDATAPSITPGIYYMIAAVALGSTAIVILLESRRED